MADGGFAVIPAIDIQDGEVVQLVGGERGTATRYGDPAEAATRWVDQGATQLHLVDLDGAFEGERRNATAIEAIVNAVDVPLQLGGGIRTRADAESLLDQGIDRIILGTAALESPSLVESLASAYPHRVVVSLDARGGEVVVEGWTEGTGVSPREAAERFADIGVGGILFTDVDVEGQLAGIRHEQIRELVRAVDIPVIASGGVASVDDIVAIRRTGAAAVVVGTALYEGRFTLEEAMDAISLA